ncbi:MAG: Plug domain-containing protein [Gammaproteobacteria bacterium]|nr:Plug domain-containing protein [Gammaproteobacteria bacterium]
MKLAFNQLRGPILFLGLLPFIPTGIAAEAADSAFEIEEVVVTARKVEESIRDVPVTVNALTANAIEERGIASLQDIADATPGFDFAQGFGRNDFRPVIRGQSNILGRPNAGLFVDGIIIEEGNASVPLAALERIEVVKGPQSALYGRSTLPRRVIWRRRFSGAW